MRSPATNGLWWPPSPRDPARRGGVACLICPLLVGRAGRSPWPIGQICRAGRVDQPYRRR